MAAGPLSIKLKCASWQQLSTIYKRDLSRGTMFLKAASPPPLGTAVRIDLTLPSSSVIVLNGVVDQHVNDPTRGAGVELKLAPIPAGSVWMIESALASEQKRRATPVAGVPIAGASSASQSQPIQAIDEGQDVANAEGELVRALLSEAESLKKLNPFLVLGVGYEAGDADVRAAFGELTKRYHPDLFARYESKELRSVAAEIFILIRDAYRKLGDDAGRQQALQALGRTTAPRAVPNRAPTPPPVPVKPPRAPTGVVPVIAPPPPPQARPFSDAQETVIPGVQQQQTFESKTGESKLQVPPRSAPAVTTPLPTRGDPTPPPVRPPPPTAKQPALPSIAPIRPPTADPHPPGTAPTERASASGSQGMRPRPPTEPPPLPAQVKRAQAQPESIPPPPLQTDRRPVPAAPPVLSNDPASSSDAIEEMLDAGNFENALNAYKVMSKKNPADRSLRAGIELCEGLRALSLRDRLEAAQRFESALEIDPSNERAARELAEMRRQATNERKGLLTRLMGKKEP
ncbi:MAG TPA: DnaJ domain-containing protein [Kofleriaceae bacterium]|jgi:tetratricopeptide (TPR) repeat protein